MLPETKSSKVNFEQDEIFKILNSEIEQEIKNFCLFGLYTGMRIGEIINLTNEDIKDGFIYVKDSKTINGIRKIPIHSKIAYLTHKQGYLFFNTPNRTQNQIGKIVNNAIHTVIDDENKTFHSFRKNFVQCLYENEIEEINIQVLVGHSTNKNITFTTYNLQKVKDSVLIDSINTISYQAVNRYNKKRLEKLKVKNDFIV